MAISGDGLTAVGTYQEADQSVAYRWSEATGRQPLFPSGASFAGDVSQDGSVIVGLRYNPGAVSSAFRWSESSGVSIAPGVGSIQPEVAFGVSDDGSVIVGRAIQTGPVTASENYGFRWTADNGVEILTDLGGGLVSASANSVAADGSTIVGNATDSRRRRAVQWQSVNFAQPLGDLPFPNAGGISIAQAVSSDGLVVVGGASIASTFDGVPFRWTEATGSQPIASVFGPGRALAVDADGDAIVGWINQEAFYWSESKGMVLLADLLTTLGSTAHQDWRLTRATGVSDDGLSVVGFGVDPNGVTGPFIARLIPEPASVSLLALMPLAWLQSTHRYRRTN